MDADERRFLTAQQFKMASLLRMRRSWPSALQDNRFISMNPWRAAGLGRRCGRSKSENTA